MINKKHASRTRIKSEIDQETTRIYKILKSVDDTHIKSLFQSGKMTPEDESNLVSYYYAKLIKINDLILSIGNSKTHIPLSSSNSPNSFDVKSFKKIRELAITPGGFLKMEFRKIIYKKIFACETYKSRLESKNIFDKKSINVIANHKYEDIINKDVNRSVLYHMRNFDSNSEFEQQLTTKDHTFITSKLGNYLKFIFQEKISEDNGYSYDYYQGFHDFSIYLLLLYMDDMHTVNIITERIIKVYLKDYTQDTNKGVFTKIATILRETVCMINPIIAEAIEANSSEAIYYLCISWIICLYGQSFKDINSMYRMLDYILTSHPITIYITAAVIIIESYEKYSFQYSADEKSSSANEAYQLSFIEFLRDIDFDKLDLDIIIQKSELIINNHGIRSIVTRLRPLFVEDSCFCKRDIVPYASNSYLDAIKNSISLACVKNLNLIYLKKNLFYKLLCTVMILLMLYKLFLYYKN